MKEIHSVAQYTSSVNKTKRESEQKLKLQLWDAVGFLSFLKRSGE